MLQDKGVKLEATSHAWDKFCFPDRDFNSEAWAAAYSGVSFHGTNLRRDVGKLENEAAAQLSQVISKYGVSGRSQGHARDAERIRDAVKNRHAEELFQGLRALGSEQISVSSSPWYQTSQPDHECKRACDEMIDKLQQLGLLPWSKLAAALSITLPELPPEITTAWGHDRGKELRELALRYGAASDSTEHAAALRKVAEAIQTRSRGSFLAALHEFANAQTGKPWDEPAVQAFETSCHKSTLAFIKKLENAKTIPWMELGQALSG